MARSWLMMLAAAVSVLELSAVMSYVVEPLPARSPRQQAVARSPRQQAVARSPRQPAVSSDDLPIVFPDSDDDEERVNRGQHSGAKRAVFDVNYDLTRYSDLYPQTAFSNVERPVVDQSAFRGPQNGFGGFGGPPSPWGNGNFNAAQRQPNRPNSFRRPQAPNPGNWGTGGNQGNWGNGGNPGNWGNGGNPGNWGNGGGDFNTPGDDDSDDVFVFDRPPPRQPGNGGGRPQPANGGGRPQPANGGDPFPRPRPSTGTQRPTAATPTPPTPGFPPTSPAPVTAPTAASTRPNCNCPSTPEFNPVCGQDRVTYSNPGKLRCANACGNNVQMLHFGACISTTTQPPSG